MIRKAWALTCPVQPVLFEFEAVVALENFENRHYVAGGRNGRPSTGWLERRSRDGRHFVEQIQRVVGRVSEIAWVEFTQSRALHLVVKVHGVRVLLVY